MKLNIFHVLICHLFILFGEVLFNIFAHALIRLFVSLLLSFEISLHILGASCSVGHVIWKYFPVCNLSLLSLNRVFYKALLSCSVMSDNLHLHGLQHSRLLCPLLSPESLLKLISIQSVISSSPSPSAFSRSQHQGLFQWVGSSH